MLRSLQKRRSTNKVLKVLAAIAVIICLAACTSIQWHGINILKQRVDDQEYEGGTIDDVRLIKCFHWFGSCRVIYDQLNSGEKFVPWLRVRKDITDEKIFAVEHGLFYNSFLYVHPSTVEGDHGCISDLVIARDKSAVPMRVLQDINDKIRSKDSSMFHKHDQKLGFWAQLLGRKSENLAVRGEDWHYKRSGVWCKYALVHSANEGKLVTNVQLFVGKGFAESRSMWRSAVTELPRKGGAPLSISVEKFDSNQVPQKYASEGHLFMRDGKFKILQISDLHIGSSDHIGDPQKTSDQLTTQFISHVLEIEDPDLVIVTGDLIDGAVTLDYQTALLKALQPMISRGTPWVVSWGLSDYSRFAPRGHLSKFVQQLPYCLVGTIKNIANLATPNTTNSAITLNKNDEVVGIIYILDSSAAENPIDFMKAAHKHTIESLTGALTYSLAFQHSPIPEYRPVGKFPIIGSFNEKGPLDVAQFGISDVLNDLGVQTLSCGKEHENDCCLFVKNVWLCYGGQTGVAGYSPAERQTSVVRLFRVDDNIREITTWKRNINNPKAVYDYQFLFNDEH
ncbi:LADA_0B04258g1_1 [Lachancea dasiensis]|uniref:LADA_0B04258g1_1 n=1 Tax=Lachancea dasiensis TaxID=1072105 RepID=A0A1G4ISW7_9SACH|nr:LADA_0B04258g1_1 [Lachancea dasiensis]